MIHLSKDHRLLLGVALCLGDVARDLGRAEDISRLIANGRYAERDIDERAILALADGFEMLNPLAAADARYDRVLFGQALVRDDDRNVLADRLLGVIQKAA